jgi:hypothetical protein
MHFGEDYTMYALREILAQAQAAATAVGHFKVADLVMLKAVLASARELKVPVLVGASEGEREFLGTGQLAALVRSLREEFDFPIFLNADHTHSLAKAVEAVKAGFDAVVFDLSALPFEQNVSQTKEAVEAKRRRPGNKKPAPPKDAGELTLRFVGEQRAARNRRCPIIGIPAVRPGIEIAPEPG